MDPVLALSVHVLGMILCWFCCAQFLLSGSQFIPATRWGCVCMHAKLLLHIHVVDFVTVVTKIEICFIYQTWYTMKMNCRHLNSTFIDRVDCQHVMRCVLHSLCTIHEHGCQLVSVLWTVTHSLLSWPVDVLHSKFRYICRYDCRH